jgi:phosphate transport system permease protein
MVFVTTLVLLVLVILLNITAIVMRNRMRKRYTMGAF